jgi:DHA1 family inner membrane transport protein
VDLVTSRGNWLVLAALALAAFVVGTSELVVVGILDPIARDAGVSISAAARSSPPTRSGSRSAARQ